MSGQGGQGPTPPPPPPPLVLPVTHKQPLPLRQSSSVCLHADTLQQHWLISSEERSVFAIPTSALQRGPSSNGNLVSSSSSSNSQGTHTKDTLLKTPQAVTQTPAASGQSGCTAELLHLVESTKAKLNCASATASSASPPAAPEPMRACFLASTGAMLVQTATHLKCVYRDSSTFPSTGLFQQVSIVSHSHITNKNTRLARALLCLECSCHTRAGMQTDKLINGQIDGRT